MEKRIFSGIQPSGKPHLGNYLGAIQHWVRIQSEGECLFCLVDLHAITNGQSSPSLSSNTREMAAILLASGVDPQRSILFQQSAAPAHTLLAWILNCVARMGWLNRMTQFKEKTGKNRQAASVGLYAYPVLQAADILAYQTTHVPVGQDQKQHIELARDIAQKFNHDTESNYFTLPEPIISPTTSRVMSLRDGTVKMSKSDTSDYSRINLSDSADTISQKIVKARTDGGDIPSEPDGLAGRPEVANLVEIFAELSQASVDKICLEYAGQGFTVFKRELTELVLEHLRPISERAELLLSDTTQIDEVLRQGAIRANAIADPIVNKALELVGFYQPPNPG